MGLDGFVSTYAPSEGDDSFEFENSKLLDMALGRNIMAKAGSMVGYTGDIPFERGPAGGLKRMLKRKTTGGGDVAIQAISTGHLYLVDQGKEVQILELNVGGKPSVNSGNVPTFEPSVNWDIGMLTSVTGISSGGLFNVSLEGPDHVAVTTRGKPIAVPTPIKTGPNAIATWNESVSLLSNRSIDIRGLPGHSSGESYQLEFAGEGGSAIVRPFERVIPGQ